MRHSTVIIVLSFAGLAAGAVVAAVPVVLLEWAVASSGFSEMVPMAAPPLGVTFRALASGAAAIVAMGVTAVILSAVKTVSEQRNKHMGFALSRLADFARGRNRRGGEDIPSMRRADAHPDARPRLPLYASRDLGEPAPMPIMMCLSPEVGEALSPVDALEQDMLANDEALEMPRAPEPLPWEAIKVEIARVRGGREHDDEAMSQSSGEDDSASVAYTQPLETMTITDLTARFEAGLQRRRASLIATAHAEQAEEMVAPESLGIATIVRLPETDADLTAALAALRGITAKAG